MLFPVLAILAGFAALVWAADRFVVGAAGTAHNLGMSPLFIGLTVVALGTSAPEMLVSGIAAFAGNPGLAIGNALGSNIANCALVLGAAALVTPLTLRTRMLTREIPVLLGIMAVAWLLMADGTLGRVGGTLLVVGVIPLVWWMVRIGKAPDLEELPGTGTVPAKALTMRRSLVWLGVGAVALLASSRAVVWGGVELATLLGVDDTVIGLSIVAIGTSLPELAASIVGALKGEHDIAVGNVLGSNMFNLLVVLGLPGMISPGPFAGQILTRDFPVMAVLTLAVLAFATIRRGGTPGLGRAAGLVLLATFVVYQLLLYDKLP